MHDPCLLRDSDSPAIPPFPAADVDALVLSNDWVNAEYKHMVLDAGTVSSRARAGQFFHLLCPSSGNAMAGDRPFFRRPMSVYGTDSGRGAVEFLYKVTGAGTRGLVTLRAGQGLRILGPLGKGFTLDPTWRRILVVGRGVGLATLAPLSAMAAARGVAVTAILSARSPDFLMSGDRFRADGADVIAVTDAEGTSAVPQIEALLRRLVGEGRADAVFTCGSNRLMLLLQRLAAEFAIPGQVALEQQMACGLGMCFCCVRSFATASGQESRRVCWDGPVFPLREAMSW